MKGCDHDLVYSGQTSTSGKFHHICRKCGQCGWSDRYSIAQVSFYDFCHLRALHGWSVSPLGATLLYLDTARKTKPRPVTRWWNTWRFPAVSSTYALLLLTIWCVWARRFSLIEAVMFVLVGTTALLSWYRVTRG